MNIIQDVVFMQRLFLFELQKSVFMKEFLMYFLK